VLWVNGTVSKREGEGGSASRSTAKTTRFNNEYRALFFLSFLIFFSRLQSLSLMRWQWYSISLWLRLDFYLTTYKELSSNFQKCPESPRALAPRIFQEGGLNNYERFSLLHLYYLGRKYDENNNSWSVLKGKSAAFSWTTFLGFVYSMKAVDWMYLSRVNMRKFEIDFS
jgi:hypothetical protein